MAIVKTDSVHYEGIASALRNLHAGEETYTPAQMAAYLATEGTELKPENIVSGATIFGVKGTMIPPPDPPPDVDADDMDMMLLTDDKGNVTWGFMLKTPDTGWCQYNKAYLPEIPTTHSGFPIVTYEGADSGGITKADLYRAGELGVTLGTNTVTVESKTNGWWHWEYDPKSATWGEAEWVEAHRDPFFFYSEVCTAYTKNIWCSEDIYIIDSGGITDGGDKLTDEIGYYGSEAIPLAFTITAYDYLTTDFKAVGWIRAAYHTTGEYAGQYTYDDFRTTPSGGWNYINNVRWCTRDELVFRENRIWPPTAPYYLYGAPSESGTIALADREGYILYSGAVLPELPETGYEYALLGTTTLSGSSHSAAFSNLPMRAGYGQHTDTDGSEGVVYTLKTETGEWTLLRAWTSEQSPPPMPSVPAIWANFDVMNYAGTAVSVAASVPVPLVSSAPVGYTDDGIPIYKKKE